MGLEHFWMWVLACMACTVFTPPELAEKYGLAVERIRNWIAGGQLRAFNLSDSDSRPRWKISEEDWQTFLDTRANCIKSPEKPKRRRKRSAAVKEYF